TPDARENRREVDFRVPEQSPSPDPADKPSAFGKDRIMADRAPSDGSFLTGIRVLELADELGEYCGKLLAGLGADVIKVEPLGGEHTRLYGPFHRDVADPNGSLYFWHYNFGKRSAIIDLDDADGQEQFRRLAQTADVIIDTRARGYLDSRGLGYDALRAGNP